MNTGQKLSVGDYVEVRTKDEILSTLNQHGRFEEMPFMPEMFAFCGKRFRVLKRAHKTCDTVFPIRGRRLTNTVHLETRCDGSAHGGCQASCLIFWKEAWLRKVSETPTALGASRAIAASVGHQSVNGGACTEKDVLQATQTRQDKSDSDVTYVCQATRLPYASGELSPWDLRQYVEDYTSGNVGVWRILQGTVYSIYYNLSESGIGWGRVMRWFYDKFRPLWGGPAWPRKEGTIPMDKPTPECTLELQPGELVRVKSHEEILKTVNVDSRNRGMAWDAELVPYCGGTYRVHKRVTKILNERTGKMQEMKTPCIILEGVVCQARYSNCRMFCPRAIYPYWREIWLERVSNAPQMLSRPDLKEPAA